MRNGFLVGVALTTMLTVACGGSPEPMTEAPAAEAPVEAAVTSADGKVTRLPIVDKAIEFHGGSIYEASTISMTVTSLSGSFEIVTTRNGGAFDHTVTGAVGRETKVMRKVHYTNDTVERWDDGVAVELDDENAQRSRDFVNSRVFFPFLPYSLKGDNVYKEDLGLETWDGRELHKVRVSYAAGTSTDADDEYMFWFDEQTGEMVMFGYDFIVSDGGLRLRKVTGTQRVGGVLFSDQENWAVDGQGYSVNQLTPEYVAQNMKIMSTVTLTNIVVTPSM
jgi:hypothetical protein